MFIPDERLLKHEFQQSPIKCKYSTTYTCNIIVANRQSMSSNYIVKNTFDTTIKYTMVHSTTKLNLTLTPLCWRVQGNVKASRNY